MGFSDTDSQAPGRYADVDARGGILEPPGIVEVKYRAPQQAGGEALIFDPVEQGSKPLFHWNVRILKWRYCTI